MLRRFPAPLHRLALRLGHQARLYVRSRLDLVSTGCTIICTNRRGQVILVRHSYMAPDKWALPGGTIMQSEQPVQAARREMREELSCTMAEARFYELERATYWDCRFDTFMIAGITDDPVQPDGREIVEAGFFDPRALPAATEPLARERIEHWLKLAEAEAAQPVAEVIMTPVGDATAASIIAQSERHSPPAERSSAGTVRRLRAG